MLDEDQHWSWDNRSIGFSLSENESDKEEGVNNISNMQKNNVRDSKKPITC